VDGSDCEPGETGELLVNGPNIMAGYWKRHEATRAAIDGEGWLHTGDAARVDNDGDVWIVDRMEDRYLSSGHIVYPGDVERLLMRHARVVDSAVVGTNVDGTQAGVAFAVVDPPASVSPRELLAFCREHLPEYAVPASISLVERIPRTSVGKVARSELQRLAA